MINQIIEQMYIIEENIKNVHNDQISFLMSKKYRELQDQLDKEVKNIEVKCEIVVPGVSYAGPSEYISPYDYNCPSCGHEFDFCDGEVYSCGNLFVVCPMCGEMVDDDPCV